MNIWAHLEGLQFRLLDEKRRYNLKKGGVHKKTLVESQVRICSPQNIPGAVKTLFTPFKA